MFESIFGLYSALTASTTTLYDHDRGVVPTFKNCSFFYPLKGIKKLKGFLRGFSTEGAQLWSLFPPHLQFWAQKDALHDGLSSYAHSVTDEMNTPMLWL